MLPESKPHTHTHTHTHTGSRARACIRIESVAAGGGWGRQGLELTLEGNFGAGKRSLARRYHLLSPVQLHACVHMRMRIRMHVCIHMHTHMHTHITHTPAHTCIHCSLASLMSGAPARRRAGDARGGGAGRSPEAAEAGVDRLICMVVLVEFEEMSKARCDTCLRLLVHVTCGCVRACVRACVHVYLRERAHTHGARLALMRVSRHSHTDTKHTHAHVRTYTNRDHCRRRMGW